MNKRKRGYTVAKTATKRARPGAGDETRMRMGVVSIDLTARAGQAGLSVGDRVTIRGTGLYADEIAVIESFVAGPVPAARVRTLSGRARTVRTVDLEPVRSSG